MENKDKLAAIDRWQSSGFIHPMTCSVGGSDHEILEGFVDENNEVKARCPSCGNVQTVPDVVYGCTENSFEKTKTWIEKVTATPIKAEDIAAGDFFRKKTGEFIYMRISESSAKYHQVRGNEDGIVGVCHNGNIAHVPFDKEVVRCDLFDFLRQHMYYHMREI